MRYEEFCGQPLETFRRVLEFAELPGSPQLERHVEATPIKTSSRWKEDLSKEQQATLNDVLREDLQRRGYEVGDQRRPLRVS